MSPQNQEEFRKALAAELHSRLTLDHPILAEIEKPQKNMRLAKLMVLQGYQLTKMFARYIACLYYNCPVVPSLARDRRLLAINLYEEETGLLSKTDGHLELMQRFAYALGITPAELESAVAIPETQDLIDYRRRLVEDPDQFHRGAAAIMIASEGQSLEQKAGKLKHELFPSTYGLTEYDMAFFTVHAAEDQYHVRDGLNLVSKICTTEKMQAEAIDTIRQTCDRFRRFYDGIQRVYEERLSPRRSAAPLFLEGRGALE